ncbi:Major Facilitator Superfamily protein [Haladaptatus litoreus]|uniref:Major Facilitator Superfamily protein n=1 Tax=Haladaptatus litoreus TaxID=553468 RepID=A0A1N6W7W4_9EURY|nr:MFS transporter [Haladaptatus litoreus]SIQ86112.1 Major Facilitator Superfamily protein [Haladaptatus litoreus]
MGRMLPGVRGERVRLAAVIWSVLLAQVLLYPGVPDLVVHLGASEQLNGGTWFLVAEFAAFVICAGIWGYLSDRFGKRVPFIVAGALGGSAGYAALAAAPTLGLPFSAVLALRVVQGAATIAAFSLSMTMLMDLRGGHGRNMGAAGIAIGLGTAMGAPIGGQLAEIHPTTPLLAASVLMVGTALLAVPTPDRVPSESRATVATALARLRDKPELSIPYAFGFIDRLTAGFFALVGTLYFQTEFGLDAGATGLMLMLFFAPFALLQYPMGRLSDRIGRFIPVVVGSICYGITVIAVGFAPTVVLAGAAMVAVGVCGAFVSPATMALVTDIAPDSDRGVAMAGFNAFGSLGFLTGFLVGGGLADSLGFETAFTVTGLLEVGIALVAFRAVYRLGDRIEQGQGSEETKTTSAE